MLFNTLSLLAMAAAATAQSSAVQPAPVIADSPAGAHVVAVLPQKANSNLSGSISAVSAPDGKGVRFTVSFAGLPAEGGPFMYHIHAKPVPSDGNCTGTAAHLDPYLRGEVPICDATKPETCQTGDLSGKFGNMTAQSWSQEYVDPYSSLNKADPSYFANLSFVVHLSNKTRIGCANFTDMSPGSDHPSAGIPKPTELPNYNASVSPSVSATGGSSPMPATPTSSTPPAQFTNAAASVVGGSTALLVAAVAALVL